MVARRRAFCFFCAATLAALAAASSFARARAQEGTGGAAVAAAAGAPGLAAPLAPPAMERLINPTRLLVKPRKGASREEIAAAHARAGGKVVQELPQIGWQIVAVPYGENVKTCERYRKESAIELAELDHGRKLAYVPNDPYWPYQWHMTDITADKAWDTVKGDPSVVVAVMDTGLDPSHSDLVANEWQNPGEIPGNGIDDDGNGYVDDVRGYDFAYGDGDPDDVFGHGTSCAGIIAAVQDNALGVTGVAPRCKVAGIKAANNSGYFYDSANVPAFTYCADMGFKVISMSFFSDEVTPAERDAVDYCWSKGMVLVAAAGNDLSLIPYYPGAYDHVISVAATDGNDNPTWFTDYGSWVDVAAPGVGIATVTLGNGYTTGFAGTSAATPHVAGLAALLFSANPNATNAQVRAALEDTAHPTVYAPWGGEYTNYGRIDCDAAVDRVTGVTTGHKAPRFLFAAPVAGNRALADRKSAAGLGPNLRWFGVGLEKPNHVAVIDGKRLVPLVAQGRQEVISGYLPTGSPSGGAWSRQYSLDVNGSLVGDFVWDDLPGAGLVYAPADVGTYSATVTGAFDEIYRVDGKVLTCDDNGGGAIYCQIPVRKVAPKKPSKITLDFTRAYSGCTGGTEVIYLYDWSTWSYPYGSWLTLAANTVSGTSMQTVTATITSNADHYVDDEGTMYFLLSTSGATSSGLLSADAFRVTVE